MSTDRFTVDTMCGKSYEYRHCDFKWQYRNLQNVHGDALDVLQLEIVDKQTNNIVAVFQARNIIVIHNAHWR